MNIWRFLDTGASNAFWNMAVDEAIFTFARERKILPTLHFYQWEPAAISIGYAQNINEGLNLKECRRLKIDLVRRYTGGGAIFHNDELTYSFISRIDAGEDFDSILASYKQVCNGIIKGLSQLGIQAKFRGGKSTSSLKERIPCFMASSKHDLIVDGEFSSGGRDGKKIVGNAQRRTKEAFLQQGSLPLSYDFDLINELFPQSDGFRDMATSISEISGKRISLKEIKRKILFGFADNFSVSFREDSLSSEELNLAKRLFKEKYSSPEWMFKEIKGER